tara:strand:+ start:1740 stop:2123 length:384 start_codon:yes stop_codon:yes gene_type:complete
MSIISTFNNQMIEFCNELEKLNINNIGISKSKLILIKKINPKKIIEIFIENIYPYKDKIIEQQLDFFNNINIKEHDNNYMIFNNIKTHWNEYSDITKDNIWLYMNLFVKLCDNYIELNKNIYKQKFI